jgi:sodium/potassium-transporting ATPase subunit alpha
MIHEALKPEWILPAQKGSLRHALAEMLRRAGIEVTEDRMHALEESLLRPEYAKADAAFPHLMLPDLEQPRVLLALFPAGVSSLHGNIFAAAMLLSPEQDSVRHLQMLERLAALLPPISRELALLKNVPAIEKRLSRAEQEQAGPTFFNVSQNDLAFELKTDLENGLSEAEALRRLALYGPNQLERAKKTRWFVRLFKSFFSFFALLLWGAGLLCFVPGVNMPQLGIAILVVVGVNGIFSFFQEQKSDNAVEALQSLLSHRCRVVRDKRTQEIDVHLLVPGDLIVLEEGDHVPADARLIEAFQVEVDNSSLTGESTSAKRYKADQPVLVAGRFMWIEMPNIVFAGSSLLKGQARAIVFGTGMRTEIGRIADLTQGIKAEESPLQKELRGTVLTISILAAFLGASFLFLGWLVAGLTFIQAFIFCIGLFVANVPEGLLPTVTLSLAMGVTRMARRSAIVKNLSSVETLGCTTVICTDKTGTLTQNLMMVTEIYADGRSIEVDGEGYDPRGQFYEDGRKIDAASLMSSPVLFRLMQCAYFCNNARIERTLKGAQMTGDPTEGALMALAMKGRIRGAHQNLRVNAFESVRKRMSVVVRTESVAGMRVYAKGAPVETVACCTHIQEGEDTRPLTEEDRAKIKLKNDEMASRGLRVLALAYRHDPQTEQNLDEAYSQEKAESRLVFLGLAAMRDPVRPGVAESIQACHTAGIRIIMVTGDYALTARSIAASIGMNLPAGDGVWSGADIAGLEDERLKELLRAQDRVFARVSPEQKLRIVSLLRDMNEIVAVTGDGVNDAPALKRAHIGIAMGKRGSDVAREAAHMVLVDDNFNSIVDAIREGRAIFENIQRFMGYVLNSNPQEMYPYILWMLFPGAPLAMTVMGVLAVDVGTDLVPAMGLGIEHPGKDVMLRPPRKRSERLLTLGFILKNYLMQGTILALACFATYFYFGWSLGLFEDGFSLLKMPASPAGLDMSQASAAYLMSLSAFFIPTVTTQIANVLSRRSTTQSLFSRSFIAEERRGEIVRSIRMFRPRLRFLRQVWEIRPVLAFQRGVALAMEKSYLLMNLFSNPLISFGIFFELMLVLLLLYSPLSEVYFFQPVPGHVWLFSLTGPAVLISFEEARKYFLRRKLERAQAA